MFIIGLIKIALYPNRNYSYPFLDAKLEYLKKHPEYNVYFVGSSRVNNQIDCKLIDSKINGIKSYNLGASASFDLESFQTMEYILENPSFKPKYIVMELQDRVKITKLNLKTERSFGVFNYDNTLFAVESQQEAKNYKQIALSLVSFVFNVFHFNKKPDEREVQKAHNYSIDQNQGFSPLDSSGIPRTKEAELNKVIKRRLNNYYADHEIYKPNSVVVKKINELAEKCRKRNIQLIMFIPGPAEPNGKKLQAYIKVLNTPVINFMNPAEYPELYWYENRWDYGHLNEKGAKILSSKMAPLLETIVK
ncbi:hypothetical protein [Chryseobacterium sp. PMSZPI]|uniref:hypothetical protein n=1 Tax=Chryseobacterium sp. PMSZPI TaxID=1033900 RepID=UPI000C32DF5D|nr:hypothetical protein [Chryseobacterium sp. PMSZPI]PKF76142.1 hypothetical protein CW752_00710 [Chryseobacterium sp. PMSZPI]